MDEGVSFTLPSDVATFRAESIGVSRLQIIHFSVVVQDLLGVVLRRVSA